MGGWWVGGWVVKLKLKLNSAQLKLELGLSLAKCKYYGSKTVILSKSKLGF